MKEIYHYNECGDCTHVEKVLMATDQINKRLAELVGIPWNEPWEELDECTGKVEICGKYDNPDFCADPRLVLREMMKREDWRLFSMVKGFWNVHRHPVATPTYTDAYLNVDDILDTTGKLALAAIAYLEGKI